MKGLLQVKAAAIAGGKPRVTGEAYLGGKLRVMWWEHPVVMDLAGMKIPKQVSLLANHRNETASRLGLIRAFRVDGVLQIDGEIVSETPLAADIITQGQAGAAWQLSIGGEPISEEIVEAGSRRTINGQEFEGPFHHIRKSILNEVSVIPVGADSATRMKVHAMALTGGSAMNFKTWVEARGIDISTLGEEEINKLRAEFAAAHPAPVVVPASVLAPLPVKVEGLDPVVVSAAAVRQERERVTAIQAACAGEYGEIEREAISSGASPQETTAKVLTAIRAARPQLGAMTRHEATTGDVLEAACALSARVQHPEKLYSVQTLEAAVKRFKNGLGLGELIIEAARANGYTGRSFKVDRDIMRSAFGGHQIQAGFSTIDIGGILSNIANKFLLQGFMSVEQTWRTIAAIRSVSDFKTVTSYRLTGALQYQKIAPDGEIKHGTLSEETYTNKAESYGLMLGITRQDQINDDLGALTAVPLRLGRGASLKLNDVFWTAFMANSDFFKTANNNYISGSTTYLSLDGLTAGELKFMQMTDADGHPTGVMPSILLTPPELSVAAATLKNSAEIRDTTSTTKYPVANPHAGKFTAAVSRYLSNASYPGYSTTAWYLLADPRDLATVEVAFLNGQEAPTVEQADADFNTLGIQMRGYHDFGVALQDFRAGIRSKGAA